MATAMAACAAMGLRAAYMGSIGNDHNGRLVTSELQQRGVDLSPVMTRDCPNRFAVITVDETSGERIVLWDRDERLNLAPGDFDPSLMRSARIVHVDDEDQQGAILAARAAREADVIVTSDIELVTPLTAQLVGLASIPIFAQHTLPALTGDSDPERGLRAIAATHPNKPICVTLGAGGAMMLDGDVLTRVPGFAIQAIDTTGAGDVFRAAFIWALLNGLDTPNMLKFANAAAAAACLREGAMASVPALDEVQRVLSGA